MKLLLLVLIVVCVVVLTRRVQAEDVPAGSIYDYKVTTIDGQEKSLADFKGKALLIVNTASRCGFTPQYKGLEALYQQYKAQGFEVLGFPANDFMGQEPGSNEEIKQFCELKYKTTFPMFAKISVRGPETAPLYRYLTENSGFNGAISWNFNKFLVNKEGKVIARFDSGVTPESAELAEKVKLAL